MRKISPFLFYLLYYAALASMAPYVVLYFQQLGFSGVEIGILSGIIPLIMLIGGPIWTGLADASRRHKLIMSLGIAGGVASGIAFPFLKTIGPVGLVMVAYAFFTSPVVSLSDSATMAMLAGEKEMYGRVRVGGTIGWAIMAAISGVLVQNYGLKMAFWGYAALLFLALLVCQGYTFPNAVEGVSILKGLRRFIGNQRWVTFMAMAFMTGMGFNMMNLFLFPYMEGLQASKTTMGLALTASTIAELPVLFYANHLLKRFGARWLLAAAMALTAVRLLLYAVLRSPEAVLGSQLMNGLTIPLFIVAGVAYADETAPQGMSATSQGLFGAMMFGFGAAAGGLLGGLLLGAVGAATMFLLGGLLMLASFIAIRLAERWLPAKSSSGSPQTAEAAPDSTPRC